MRISKLNRFNPLCILTKKLKNDHKLSFFSSNPKDCINTSQGWNEDFFNSPFREEIKLKKSIQNEQLIRFKIFLIIIFLIGMNSCTEKKETVNNKMQNLPNIILVMADDLGWGDVAYNGNTIVQTPNLDEMANNGLKLNRFYAAAPVCSPTRASCLTGRHPYRVKIPWAGDGYIHPNEITLAEALKTKGYATGHFGKWHVGGLSETVKQSYFPGSPTTYSPPWENGFDVSFSTESMVPTYNPYYHVGGAFGNHDYRHIQTVPVSKGQQTNGAKWRDYYWTSEDTYVEDLEGDDAKIVMDEALKFINEKTQNKQHFLSLIWFHNVHTPVVSGNENRKLYEDLSMKEQHWFGSITAMDNQIGRLRNELKKLNISDNTLVWFCSDNGPSYIHNLNSAGPYRGKKAELFEGGIIVPSIVEWPAEFKNPSEINVPMVTSDFYPTILNYLGIEMHKQPQIDGEDVLGILKETQKERKNSIGFRSPIPNRLKKQEVENEEQLALIGSQYKLITIDNGNSYQLYDLKNDILETMDLSEKFPDVKEELLKQLKNWSLSIDEELNSTENK